MRVNWTAVAVWAGVTGLAAAFWWFAVQFVLELGR